MSKRSPKLYLEDIVNSISKIEDYIKDMSSDSFSNNHMVVDAVVRNLEIIGEAARNMPEEFTDKHTDIPWQEMVSMRNKIIHVYFGVDNDILWKTIKEDLPKLKKQMEFLTGI